MALRILIVEDDPTFRRVLTLLFDQQWTVDAAPDAETAVEMVRAHRPDLALVDFHLPGMDGLEFARLMREAPETRDIPVMMLSGVATEPVRVRAFSEGVRDFLVKPVTEAELRARVDAIVRTAEDRRKEMAEAHRKLCESEERLSLLLSAVKECAIFMLDRQGLVTHWNPDARVMSGYVEGEILGKPFSAFYRPQGQHKPADLLREAVRQGRVEAEGWGIRKDGSTFWASVVITPVHDETGTLRGFAQVTRDLTAHKEAADERQRLLEEAESASRAKDHFLSLLSHELRTPLNAIVGWTHLLRTAGIDGARRDHALEIIDRNAALLAELVQQILDLSAMLAGRVTLEMTAVHLMHPVAMAIEAVRAEAERKGVELASRIGAVGPVHGDARRLQQVVVSLLTNAVKFTPPSGRVEVGVSATQDEAVVTVADTGEGIPAAFRSRLYEPFEQADPSTTRKHGGLGLGMAIARRLVELHQGRIDAQSGQGGGTTFTIHLPLLRGAARVSELDAPGPAKETRLDGVRVLVVDDNHDSREIIAALLTTAGAAVLTAENASTGLAVLRRERPDVLLADIEMPGESGLQLMQQVVALSARDGGATPAAALTAYGSEEHRAQAIAAGFLVHIPKPVRPVELIETVARLAALRADAAGEVAP